MSFLNIDAGGTGLDVCPDVRSQILYSREPLGTHHAEIRTLVGVNVGLVSVLERRPRVIVVVN